jgi:hypothetical protein
MMKKTGLYFVYKAFCIGPGFLCEIAYGVTSANRSLESALENIADSHKLTSWLYKDSDWKAVKVSDFFMTEFDAFECLKHMEAKRNYETVLGNVTFIDRY